MIAFALLSWLCIAAALALLIGAAIREADRQIDAALTDYRVEVRDDATWLDDQPAEVLSPAEVDRRITRTGVWL